MEHSIHWQKTLREQVYPKRIPRPRRNSVPSAQVISPIKRPVAPAPVHNLKKERKLSVVEEEDSNVRNNQRLPSLSVKPTGKKWEVFAQQPKVAKQEVVVEVKGGKKILRKTQSSINWFSNKRVAAIKKGTKLTSLPEPDQSSLLIPDVPAPLLSPVPLPAGVICIDPLPEDDSTGCYEAACVAYVNQREQKFLFPGKVIVGSSKRMEGHRSLLMDWILEVSAHFCVSQDTLYATVALIDATLAKRAVASDQLQLVAVTSFLLSSKLEEYHPPSIASLIELTDNSYKMSDVLKMERTLVEVHEGDIRMADPTVLIKRFLKAAFEQDNRVFRETLLLFYDSFITSLEYSGMEACLKAAAATRAALNLLRSEGEEQWTPTLQHYTGFEEKALHELAKRMTETVLAKVTKSEKSGQREGLVRKYSSSRHDRLLKKTELSRDNLEKALKRFV